MVLMLLAWVLLLGLSWVLLLLLQGYCCSAVVGTGCAVSCPLIAAVFETEQATYEEVATKHAVCTTAVLAVIK